MAVFIIEHMEEGIGEWCLIEYKHISKIVGKEKLWFTNVKRDGEKLGGLGRVLEESVSELDLDLSKVCVLDADGESDLKSEDGKKFEYYVFGGILGDNPPRKRTIDIIKKMTGVKVRSLGKEQMPTDNAVYVVKEVIMGKEIGEMKFKDGMDIKINEVLTTELPYRYVIVNGKELISEELVRHIRKTDSDID